MSYATTETATYTVSDISKVFDMFAADYYMVAQATGLETQAEVTKAVSDIKAFANADYLTSVTLCLLDSSGKSIKAAVYEISKDAASWTSGRPGNNLWPLSSGGSLHVIISYSKQWSGLSEAGKVTFRSKLRCTWTATTIDTSFPLLHGYADRVYSSNAYGLSKKAYS